MQFRLLGQVEIESNGQLLPLPRRRARCLLAILLLQLNRSVPVDRLAHLLWDDDPPPLARRNIHSHVSRLRSVLAAADGNGPELEFLGDGYRLGADPQTVDVHEFQALLDRAATVGGGDRRIEVLRAALDLWRGPALGNAASDWLRGRLCAGLEEQRMSATEDLIATSIAAGREREVLPLLTQIAAVHPGRESLIALHMQALYQVGRKAEALEVYARARDYLCQELGLDPSSRLRGLHQGILRDKLPAARPEGGPGRTPPSAASSSASSSSASPGSASPGSATPSGSGPTIVPRQLPPAVAGFTGRDSTLAELDALVPGEAGSPTSVVVSAIGGTAGVGKTALAVYWAHRVAHLFPDGQLYVNLRGFSPGMPPMPPDEAIRILLHGLEVPPQRIPADLDAQVGLYRSVVAGRRILILLDNARDAEQVRPLLPGAAGSVVVVTSRSTLSGLVAAEGARSVTLDLLSQAEARRLLERRLSARRVAEAAEVIDEIILGCARLPLALVLVSARAAARPELPLDHLATELGEARTRLAALSDPDPTVDVRTAIDLSYRSLSDGAADLFRLLAVHPGPDASLPAVASLAGVSTEQARAYLGELARGHLIEEHSMGRYGYHDLLRAYAQDLVAEAEAGGRARAALRRALDHYLDTSVRACLLLSPYRSPVTPPPVGMGVTLHPIRDSEHAISWFATEHPVLREAIAEAAGAGFDAHAWQLAWALSSFLGIRGLHREQLATQETALAAARRQADPTAQAHAQRLIGFAELRLGDFDSAREHLREALGLSRRLGDHVSQAEIHTSLGMICALECHHGEAVDHAQRALEVYRAAGHRMGEAFVLNNLGYTYGLLGDFSRSLDYCQQSLVLHDQAGNPRGQAAAWDSCGFAHHHLGNHPEAVACYQRALKLYAETGDSGNQAEVLIHLGDTYHATRDHPAARDAWRCALAIMRDLDHPDTDQLRTKLERV